MLANIFTCDTAWNAVQRMGEHIREVGRLRKRDRFYFLDALVQQQLQDAYQGGDLPVDLPEGQAWLITRLQALFPHPLDHLTAGCPPEDLDTHLAQALKTHLKSQSTGTWHVRTERAPELGATLRVRWLHEAQRRTYTSSVVLLEFRQYAAVPTAALQQLATIPAFDDAAADEAKRAWHATYGQAAIAARTVQQRLATPLKTITIAVWLASVPVPAWRYRTSQPGKSLQEQLCEVWNAYLQVRKDRLAQGSDAQHWKWVYAPPRLDTNHITFLVLLYLLQERMLDLTEESALFLTRYVRKFLGGREGWDTLVEHMRLHFVLPQDWRVLCSYIRETLQGFQKTARQRQRWDASIAHSLASSEDRSPGGTQKDAPLATFPEAVVLLARQGVCVSRRTLYHWAKQKKLPYVIDAGEQKLTPDGLQRAAGLAQPRHQRKALREYLVGKRGIQEASAKRYIGRRTRRGATLETITRELLASTDQEDTDAPTA